MLIEFSVTNFRSIRDRQTLSLVAGSSKEHGARNFVRSADDIGPILRSALILGPNAAGKSNLFKAIHALQQLIVGSAVKSQEGQQLPVTPFLLRETSSREPSEFDISFVANGTRYEFACSVSPERVHKESMVAYPKGRPQRWFEREYDSKKQRYEWWFGPNFRGDKKEKEVWQEFTRANALFFSTAIQLNNEQLKAPFRWIADQLIIVRPGVDLNPFLSLELLRAGDNQVMQFMRAADVGISRLELQEEDLPAQGQFRSKSGAIFHINVEGTSSDAQPPKGKLMHVVSWHKRDTGEDVPFNFDNDESDGTKRLFQYTGGWLRALNRGATLFVDELDRSLHPHITRFLVELFHGKNNPNHAQLVFTTHDATLLDTELIRRDQVWFVEKDKTQATRLYPLLEYSPRKEEALERGYLKGRYGAVPLVTNLEH